MVHLHSTVMNPFDSLLEITESVLLLIRSEVGNTVDKGALCEQYERLSRIATNIGNQAPTSREVIPSISRTRNICKVLKGPCIPVRDPGRRTGRRTSGTGLYSHSMYDYASDSKLFELRSRYSRRQWIGSLGLPGSNSRILKCESLFKGEFWYVEDSLP